MSKRRRFAWAVAIIAGTALVGTFTFYRVLTRTEWGRKKFITWAINSLNGTFAGRGKITVGALYELNSAGIRAGDVSLLDTAGTVVMHVNELRGSVSYSALLNKMIHITQLDVRGVQLNLKRDFTGPWNIAYIINGGPVKPGPHIPSYSDDIRIDKIALSDGIIAMRYPWSANAMFTGKIRDSVVAMRKSLHEITVVPQGLIESRAVVLPRVVAHDVLVATPGDDPSSLQLDSLGLTLSDPAVRVEHTHGVLRWTPDSLLLDLPFVALPASTASAKGKVNWDRPGPVRYDVNVVAQAGLSDLGWIWPVLPSTGKGTANVRLRTLENADNAEYTLSKLDVSTMKSRVTGDITVVARPDILLLQGVDLSFKPMRSELLRRLSYDAIPKEVVGTFEGRLLAKAGGPITSLQVDRIDATFTDDNAAGARSTLVASGVVGFGVNPVARNVRVADAVIDLKTVRGILPATPPVDGVIRGSMLIASADLKQASIPTLDLNWTDAAGNESHVTGKANVQYAGATPIVNTELLLDPFALKALVRVDTTFPISAALRGTVSASGPLDSLKWSAALSNRNGKMTGAGLASLKDSLWMVQANTELGAVDIRDWVGRADLPSTNLNGTAAFRVAMQLRPDSTTHITDATFNVDVKQAAADSQPSFALRGIGALDEARLRVDSATAVLGGINIELKGALARDSVAVDTLVASIAADSLGAARPELLRLADMLVPIDTAIAKTIRSYASDTLEADVSGSAVMVGSLPAFSANVSLSARKVQVGILDVRRVFGSVRATGLPDHAHFDATASVDDITGIGQIRLQNAEFKIEDASPDSGRLSLDVVARDTTALRIRGDFTRVNEVLSVHMDTVRFNYGDARWMNERPGLLVSDTRGLRMDSLVVRSNQGGLLSLNADVPVEGEVNALLKVERFPAGEVATFATTAKTRYAGLLTGETKLTGTRLAPRIVWNMVGDSVGTKTISAPPLVTDGVYEDKRLVAHVVLEDPVRSRLRFEARVPIDLTIQSVEKRLLSDKIDAEIVADTLQLAGLPLNVEGVSDIKGTLTGRIALSGTVDRPIGTGRMSLDGFSASADLLGIKPSEGQVVIAAVEDQITVEKFRFRSGTRLSDTVGVTGVLQFPAGKPMTIDVNAVANNALLADQNDGTSLNLSGTMSAKGELKKPDVTASLFVPRANLVADPLGARAALDLNSAQARELLGEAEIPIATGVVDPIARLGQYMRISSAKVAMGDAVWVRTPEAAVKLTGELDITTAPSGLLAFDGEVNADRGTFRLELGVVQRTFTVDSGKVRFYGNDAIPPRVNVNATYLVRGVNGTSDTPIHVAISGTFNDLALKLSTDDEVFSGAPESEVISLLIFGAPTFALNTSNQNTVKAVTTGVLASSLNGFVEGRLQQLLRVNTVQVNTGGAAKSEYTSIFDNLNLGLGKQIGDRTFLRGSAGVCRGTSGSSEVRITTGLSVEYRIRKSLLAQAGVDQGASPCTQLAGSTKNTYQFGFDLFREWVW